MTMKLVDGVLTPLTAQEQAEYDARQASPPPSPVPASATNLQARYVLRRTPTATPGVTLFDVIDAHAKATGGDLLDAWEYGNVFERNSAMMVGLATEFGISSAAMDDLFRAAGAVTL